MSQQLQTQAPSMLNNKDVPAPVFLFELTMAHIAGQALYVSCMLNIAEQLSKGPKSVEELARGSHCSEPVNATYLYRVLRTLSGMGIFEELPTAPGTFQNTERSEMLKEDHPMTMKAMIMIQQGGEHIKTMTNLHYAVKNGTSAFTYANNCGNVWDYFHKVAPERGLLFNKCMKTISMGFTDAILKAYDFKAGNIKHIVDVGGSLGHLSAAILEHSDPSTVATVLDLPAVIEHAKAEQQLKMTENSGDEKSASASSSSSSAIYKRITFQAGDFFKSVPSGGDLYIMKWIIHDHDDAKSKQILKTIRKAMPTHAKLLIFDSVLNGANQYHAFKLLDLLMMTMLDGKERSAQEFKDLVSDCGLVVTQVFPQANIVECRPV